MSLKFICPNCDHWIITQYLRSGENAKCRNCGSMVRVPEVVAKTNELPEYLRHAQHGLPTEH